MTKTHPSLSLHVLGNMFFLSCILFHDIPVKLISERSPRDVTNVVGVGVGSAARSDARAARGEKRPSKSNKIKDLASWRTDGPSPRWFSGVTTRGYARSLEPMQSGIRVAAASTSQTMSWLRRVGSSAAPWSKGVSCTGGAMSKTTCQRAFERISFRLIAPAHSLDDRHHRESRWPGPSSHKHISELVTAPTGA